jgi:hypothetical protein
MKSILNRIDTRLFSAITDFIGYERNMHPMLNVSRYHRAAWKFAIGICYADLFGSSRLAIDLHYTPEMRIRYSAPQLMWEYVTLIRGWRKFEYIKQVLIPIILDRPDQNLIWDTKYMWLWSDEMRSYIPTKYINKLVLSCLQDGDYVSITSILHTHPEIRIGETELPCLVTGLRDNIRIMFVFGMSEDSIQLIKCMNRYGKPYLLGSYEMTCMADDENWEFDIDVDMLGPDPEHYVNEVSITNKCMTKLINELEIRKLWPKWIESYKNKIMG